MLNLKTIRVCVVCNDPLVSAGLKAAFSEQLDFDLLGIRPKADLGWLGAADMRADVIVADYDQGVSLVAETSRPSTAFGAWKPKVLILTARNSEWEIRNALEFGVRGYLIQGCGLDELVEGVRAVNRGMRHICGTAARRLADSIACATLTGREVDVLRLVAEGQGNKAIARELAIAVGTVKSHLKAIFEKLGAKSRTEVATVAERRGLLTMVAVRPELDTSAASTNQRSFRIAGSAMH